MPYVETDQGTMYVTGARLAQLEQGGGGGTGDVTQQDLEDAIADHSAQTQDVHGISDTAHIKGVAVAADLESGGVSARPAGFASVEFVQADDPDELAENADTWSPTVEPE